MKPTTIRLFSRENSLKILHVYIDEQRQGWNISH